MKNLITCTILLALAGCLSPFERADPASKSARATYGAISVVASGDNSTATLTLGDGAFTAADGDGDTSSSATLTTRTDAKFDITMPASAFGYLVGAAYHLGMRGIDALAGTGSSQSTAASASAKSVNASCPDGSCSIDPSCPNGNCSIDPHCADGSCSIDASCPDGSCAD